jgi:transcription elongation factor GreA
VHGEFFLEARETMNGKKIYLTKEGLEELKKEHEELSKVRRVEVVERLSAARDQGDLSENAEYHAAREELSFIDGRIDELEELLKQVVLIEDTKGEIIALGSKVTLKVKGQDAIYSVVGEWEADPKERKISHESPLGKALMGRKIGETIEVTAPAGIITYTVVAVN